MVNLVIGDFTLCYKYYVKKIKEDIAAGKKIMIMCWYHNEYNELVKLFDGKVDKLVFSNIRYGSVLSFLDNVFDGYDSIYFFNNTCIFNAVEMMQITTLLSKLNSDCYFRHSTVDRGILDEFDSREKFVKEINNCNKIKFYPILCENCGTTYIAKVDGEVTVADVCYIKNYIRRTKIYTLQEGEVDDGQ